MQPLWVALAFITQTYNGTGDQSGWNEVKAPQNLQTTKYIWSDCMTNKRFLLFYLNMTWCTWDIFHVWMNMGWFLHLSEEWCCSFCRKEELVRNRCRILLEPLLTLKKHRHHASGTLEMTNGRFECILMSLHFLMLCCVQRLKIIYHKQANALRVMYREALITGSTHGHRNEVLRLCLHMLLFFILIMFGSKASFKRSADWRRSVQHFDF